jgi:hypothetical protein
VCCVNASSFRRNSIKETKNEEPKEKKKSWMKTRNVCCDMLSGVGKWYEENFQFAVVAMGWHSSTTLDYKENFEKLKCPKTEDSFNWLAVDGLALLGWDCSYGFGKLNSHLEPVGKDTTLASCAEFCDSKSNCKGFDHNASNGECRLLAQVKENRERNETPHYWRFCARQVTKCKDYTCDTRFFQKDPQPEDCGVQACDDATCCKECVKTAHCEEVNGQNDCGDCIGCEENYELTGEKGDKKCSREVPLQALLNEGHTLHQGHHLGA